MLGTHKYPIGQTKKKFKNEVRDNEEMRIWYQESKKEAKFRAKIKAKYRKQFEITLAAKLKKMENENERTLK